MKKLFKKSIACLIAVLMIVSSMPLTAFARDTGLAEADPYWTRVASSNFDQTTNIGSANNKAYSFAQSPTLKANDKAMTWSGVDYNSAMSSDGSGLYVDDGYIYLSAYNGNTTTPVTGKANFKIDVELEWTVKNDNANSQRYCTLQLANGTALGKTSAAMGSSASNIIAQDYYGKVYIGTTGYGTDGTSNCISPYSANITTGKKYHYIMTYANKTLKTYVTDENYTVMQDVCTVENVDINTSAINSICLGDDDNSYYFKNTKYHSITFYEGKTTSVKPADTTNKKYLFAYFTGNASNDESLHLAVSTDGLQWKTLNKNFPVWNGTAATSIYPDNSGNSGVAATTHIRDPYIMRAQDGSYYVFATDLDTQGGTNWGNNSKMHVFKASSLTAFKDNSVEHWDIDMQSIMANVLGGNTIRTWAPQAIYDPEYGQYMLYWSAATDSYGTTSMYYVYTEDFKTFTTTPKRLISPIGAGDNGDLNQANIDGDIYYNGQFYYLWYKNEATASLAVMTSESPSGPYTNLKAFSYSQALEGPQIYQLQNNQYILLADAYNNYCYRAFVSSTVDGFTAQSEISNTNINSLQPRHGAVIQIDDAEYNSLVNTFGIDANDGVVRYEFSLDHENNSNTYAGGIWEGNQYQYDIGYRNEDSSTARMGNGKAVLSGKNLFINDTNVRSIIQNPTFTFSFKFKLTQNVADKNPVIFATCNPTTDFVQLLEDGTFSVNGKTCTNQANIVVGEEHTYTIAYSGVDETAILLQDGNLVGAIPTGPMDNTGALFVGLGFSDVKSGEGRIYGEYSALTFQKSIPDAVKTKLEANIVDTSLEEIHAAKGTITTGDVNAKTIEKFGKTGYFQTIEATNTPWSGVKGYNNILYSSQTVNSPGALNLGYLDWKVHMPNKYVLVYDGIDSNRPNFPVVLEAKWKKRYNGNYYQAKYCSVYSSVPFELPYKWKGGNTGWSATTVWNTAIGGSEEIGNSSSNQSSLKHTDETPRFYANIMKYNGSGNNTNYYDKYSSIQYQMYSSWSSNTKQQTTTGDIYVLNYKPIRDIINGIVTPTVDGNPYTFRTLFNEVSNNEKKYTKESIIAYYNAVNDIMSLNVGNYFTNTTNDSNVEGQVTSAAEAIKNAVNNYNTAVAGLTRQYKVTFKKAQADGGQAIKAIYVLGETAKKDIIIAAAPINTARWYDNTNHYDYSWTLNNDVTTDIDIYETRTATAHSYSNKGISGDTATVECSKCGHYYELDYSAYNAKLTILQDKLADTDRYTLSSIEAATNAMNAVTANVSQPLTKDEVDALVRELISAEQLLVVKTFTLTFNVYLGEDKNKLEYTEELNDVPYGDSRLLSLPETYQTGYAVTKWTRTIESSDSIIGTTTSSLTIIANSNASYNVFIKSTAAPVDDKMVTATLNNKSNKVVDVAYVNKGINTVSINNSSITLTNGDSKTTLTAPSYSFYYVSGFTVNGVTVYDDSSVEINDTTVIRPIYDVKNRFIVVLDTNVKTNKGETGSVEKGWDERITVTADDADENTQWLYRYKLSDGSYSESEVIGYGKTVSLQVTQSCKISYNKGQTAQPQVSMDYVSYDVYKPKTITAVGRYYLPENCTKVSAGVILKTSNKKKGATNTPSWDALLVQDNYKITNKSGVFEATSFVSDTNQYAINFYSSSDYQTMYIGAVAYLTYTDGTNKYTIYSDIATYEYNASAE